MKGNITFDQFVAIQETLDIRLGTIQSVDRVPKSDKMLKLSVFFTDTDTRTVLTNIGDQINPNDLMFITLPFVMNLEPRKIMGIESQAMIMVPTKNGVIDLGGSSGSSLLN